MCPLSSQVSIRITEPGRYTISAACPKTRAPRACPHFALSISTSVTPSCPKTRAPGPCPRATVSVAPLRAGAGGPGTYDVTVAPGQPVTLTGLVEESGEANSAMPDVSTTRSVAHAGDADVE